MDLLVIVFSILLILALYYGTKVVTWLFKIREIRKALEVFLVSKPHWLLGHLKEHPGPNEAGMMKNLEWTEKADKGCYAVLYPLRPTLVLCHPDTVKAILKTAEPKGILAALGRSYWILDYWLGNGLLSSNGKYWSRNRRLITPGFHFDVLKPYVEVYNGCVEQLMDTIDKRSIGGESVEIYTPVSLCALSVIMKCSFGSSQDVEDAGEDSEYVKCVNNLSYYIFQRLFNPLCYFDFIYFLTRRGKEFLKNCKFSHSVTGSCILQRQEALKHANEGDKKHLDFLDILLLARDETGKALTFKEIQDEVETFMFEGHDTTSSGIAWCLYNLAKHPEIQKRAQKEVDEVMKGNSSIGWSDLGNLPYLTQCIKESLRLNTAVTFVQRELSKRMTIAGQRIEAGTPIEINFWALHHNSRVWGKDHMEYKPDRFLPEEVAKRDSYAFVPFSAGPRNCIGQNFAMNEMKVTIGRVLNRFDMILDEEHHCEMTPELVNRPKDGIKIFFKRR